jgi:hypothetical protein
MPGGADSCSQATIAERSRGGLRRSTGSVRNLRTEITMHDGLPTLAHAAPPRPCAAAYAATNHTAGDAATTIHGGASVCQSEIPHLRTSALPVTRTARSTNGNQPSSSRLQPETHAEHPRRTQANSGPTNRLNRCHRPLLDCREGQASPQNKKAMLRNPEHRFNPLIASCFVTV